MPSAESFSCNRDEDIEGRDQTRHSQFSNVKTEMGHSHGSKLGTVT